jgi:predicted MPP superfamily phosphohydrolase
MTQCLLAAAFIAAVTALKILQLTDIHYDPYYRENASLPSSCHDLDDNQEGPTAGLYGARLCDTPAVLVKDLLDYIANLTFDLLLITGDNARFADG